MSLTRSLHSRRSPSIRCFCLSKAFNEFGPQDSAAAATDAGSSQLVVSHSSEDKDDSVSGESSSNRWADLLPELLAEIIDRVEAAGNTWPRRRSIVACGCVCKKWRVVKMEIVKSPLSTGKITFPSCLKQLFRARENSFSCT